MQSSPVILLGPTNPPLPLFVQVTDIDSSSATIQWAISSIAYANETYYSVMYGTNFDDLNITNLQYKRKLNTLYTIELSNLEPCVTYYYSVVSNNTDGSAASGLRTFTTRESELMHYNKHCMH